MPSTIEPVVPAGRMARVAQPVLQAAELTLRPWQPSDAADVVRAYSLPDIQQWHVQSVEEAEAAGWIRSRAQRWGQEQGADWAITDATGMLGRIGLNHVALVHGVGDVVYWVLPEARGRRVAARALLTMTDWAFDELGLPRLELMHSVRNPASCRVAQVAGYLPEGIRRGLMLHPDGWHDMHLHARLATDPRP